MKLLLAAMVRVLSIGRSREGAWIEINSAKAQQKHADIVAPARERGLKLHKKQIYCYTNGRSREGAWIEIGLCPALGKQRLSRSRERAWIEMHRRN